MHERTLKFIIFASDLQFTTDNDTTISHLICNYNSRCRTDNNKHLCWAQEQWTEAQQERLELQRARVLEVNRHLATLTDSWERGGLPLHMNLAVHHASPAPHDILSRLKQQNHLLTEVTPTLWSEKTQISLFTIKPWHFIFNVYNTVMLKELDSAIVKLSCTKKYIICIIIF